ncbi:GNAT family N-acetyltransferase [Pseudomonas petrae]|uniref:GNAT family N-acetyltransferase n=1 Tax=Pseudomonas petrae TaxID=2912190 RepID=A0ABS9IBI5_9PSED|nr:GNAT family N-acetyltransferase [Pseudomonas petrae]MCF7535393.1 GNAT family N-acetyltransferase [Pseudomonas petrae]MCF7540239.1 GNAT family N-acetyltransferase [Pseudomonas petrae]MCF7545070.1 GNAT family N-acetyltransferase [Pseudomonas petrae]MCF7558792.1 GNAT family N-acetyltransferase [Pseudomonas petrae]
MNPSFIPLHTNRLILRELTPDDTPALAQILGDAEVMRYSVGGALSERATGEFIDWCRFSYSKRGFGPWAVVEKSTSTLAGFCGLNAELVDEKDEIEIGYRLATGFWGKGLGTEAARSAVSYGFDQMRVSSLIAIVQPANFASVKVIQKLGFGGFVHSQYHRQGVRVYRMTAQQWALGGSAELA